MSDQAAMQVNAALISELEKAGGDFVSPPIIMPASVLLELSGESIRGRLCSFTGPDGEEHCMRPDMTAAIAREVANGNAAPERYRYSGRVFRFPVTGTDEAIEFVQTGFEWFGGEGGPEEDAEGLALALEALSRAGLSKGQLRFGDGALFHAFVDALGLKSPWPERFRKTYNRRHGPRELIAHAGDKDVRSPLATALASLPEDEARAAVEEVFTVSGIAPVGGRDAGEVARRLIALSETQKAGPLPREAADAILAFLDVSGPAREAADAIAAIARGAGVSLDEALQAYATRLDVLEGMGAPMVASARFGAEFGRRFDYYDGLVFEVAHPAFDDGRAVASGGRYDGLLSLLSEGGTSATAFGVAIRPDRVLQAASMEAGA